MSHAVAAHDAHHHDSDTTDVFGFWLYILSDCLLFATLFATFAVLRTSTFGVATMKDITSLPFVLVETLLLLTSSLTFGFSMLSAYKKRASGVKFWLSITFLLGAAFVAMEVYEFAHLYHEGHGWQTSAAMSAFFTLVGTHGLHVSIGLFWILIMLLQLSLQGVNNNIMRRMTYLGLFWHFLDIVWIFVFTIVYLMGVV